MSAPSAAADRDRATDWTGGPAKWAAVGFIAGAAAASLAWGLLGRTPTVEIVRGPAPTPSHWQVSPPPPPITAYGGIPVSGAPGAAPQQDFSGLIAGVSDGPGAMAPAEGPGAAPAPEQSPPRSAEPPRALEPVPAAPVETRPADGPMRINVNTASQAELELLPGIGPSLAAAIIDERRRNGPFRTVSDLRRVRGIGEKRAATLAPHVVFE